MEQITRRSFVTGVLAATSVSAYADLAQSPLLAEVERLPGSTREEKRKKALLAWAVEDIAAAQIAGMTDDAAALIADVEGALNNPLGSPAPFNPGLFPKIATKQGNPWLDKTIQKVWSLVAAGQTFPRGANPDGKKLGITYGYPYIQLGQEGSLLAQAFGNPETDLYGDPRLIAPMMRRFTASYEILTPRSKHLADFGSSPHLSEMYCLLKFAFPDLILPSRQATWERAIALNSDAILRNPGQVFSEPGMPTEILEQMFLHPQPGDCYPNAQSHLMNALLFSGMALNNKRYIEVATSGVKLMGTAFWPDGGTAYIDVQNECFTYHGIMIEDLARLWQVTGNPLALDLVKQSRWYYPLSITPQGVVEYSTAPCWKHYWNATKGTSTAAIVSSILDCGYNAQVGENDAPAALWLAATVYKPIAKQPWWNEAITYDRNIEGPRGRFGQYSFCGTARNTLQAKRGKLTYVGSLWVENTDGGEKALRGWPINAGLDGAWTEVRVNTKAETVNRWDTHACTSRDETVASLANEHFGTITARYRIAQYGQDPIAFQGLQQWLLTQQRLVGLLSLESLADQDAFSMGIAIKTVCGRDTSGIRKEWRQNGPNLFEYGALSVRLWSLGDSAGDLVRGGSILTGYTDTFSGNTRKCGLITLVDAGASKVQQEQKTHYAKGTRFHAAVEIYPTVFGGAASVSVLPCPNGLIGLELKELHQTLQLIHNPGSTSATVTNELGAGTMHRSGEKHRLAFLPAVESVAPVAITAAATLSAGEHVVVRRTVL